MPSNKIVFFLVLLGCRTLVAHDHRELEAAEIRIIELQHKFDHCRKANELKDELIHILKHSLHHKEKKERYHELIKLLEAFGL